MCRILLRSLLFLVVTFDFCLCPASGTLQEIKKCGFDRQYHCFYEDGGGSQYDFDDAAAACANEGKRLASIRTVNDQQSMAACATAFALMEGKTSLSGHGYIGFNDNYNPKNDDEWPQAKSNLISINEAYSSSCDSNLNDKKCVIFNMDTKCLKSYV